MTAADGATVRFLALEPDAELHALVAAYKRRTAERVGPQLYLTDPPHLTVYLAAFPAGFTALPHVAPLLTGEPPPAVRVIGWHLFAGDALTGLNTLVCALHPEDKVVLRRLQRRLVGALAPRRDRQATEARLGPRLGCLSPEQRAAVAETGFPYLGGGWEPHFTVASVRAADWPALWADLGARPPSGAFRCVALQEYELEGLEPRPCGAVAFASG